MVRQIYVNLPVADVAASRAFFEGLGYSADMRFTDDRAACIAFGGGVNAMLLSREFFKTFTDKDIADTTKSVEALLALEVDSRDEVDALMVRALAAGGREPRPAQDHGFMYARDFEDPDGHVWEVFWMDPTGPQ